MYYQFSSEAPLRVSVHHIVDDRTRVHTYDYFYQFEKDLDSWLILKDFESNNCVDNKIQFSVNRQVYLEVTFLEIGKFESIPLFYAAWLDYKTRMPHSNRRLHSGKKSKQRKVKDHKLKQSLQASSCEERVHAEGVRIKSRPCSRFNRKYDFW